MVPPISGETQLAVVIGSPVRHSLSPAIHNAAFAAVGLDAVYLAMPVQPDDAGRAVDAMRHFGWLGMSVTMPHKDAVMAAADEVTPTALALGAANCLFWKGELIAADSTDGEGFVRGLADELGVSPSGKRCVVLGAGGAARAVIRSLAEAGATDIAVVNRSADRAAVAASHGGPVARVADHKALSEADLVINGTPVGMAGAGADDAVPCDVAMLRDEAVVSDLIYHPAETPLLAAAKARGLRTQNGVAMLVFQAAVAFEHWTGIDAPVDAMKAAVEHHLAN